MIIPHDQLQPATLNALLEEFVTRDGALHGHRDISSDQKINDVLRQLEAGRAVVVYDEDSESASIVMRDSLRPKSDAESDSTHTSNEPEAGADFDEFPDDFQG